VGLAIFARRFARTCSGHGTHDLAGQIELHDLAGMAMRQPDVLIGAHEQPARRAGMLRLADVAAVGVEHLDAGVVAIGYVKQPLRVEHQRVGQIEFTRPAALAAPALDEVAVPVELEHKRFGLAVALQHEDVTGRPDHGLVRFVQQPQMPERMPFAAVALDAQHHFEAPCGTELVNQVRRDVGCPDVVLRIDPQAMGALEQAIAEPADKAAVRIELHHRHRSAMDDEDVASGVEGDPRCAAKIHAGRQLERFCNCNIGKRWGFNLHRKRVSHPEIRSPSAARRAAQRN
jgi:hypothetical protein